MTGLRPSGRIRIAAALAATCAGGFALALVVAAPGSSQPALSTPSLPLPSVTLPVTLPTLTSPSVTLPTGALPTGATTTGGGGGGGGGGTGPSTTTSPATPTVPGAGGAVAGGSPRCVRRSTRPDSRCTPGHAAQITRRSACARPRRLPAVTAAVRRAVLADYGVAPGEAAFYRVDRLIGAALGGTNARRNLWPVQSRLPVSRQKQWLDTRLLRLVCTGRMTIGAARRAVSRDWLGTYRRLHR